MDHARCIWPWQPRRLGPTWSSVIHLCPHAFVFFVPSPTHACVTQATRIKTGAVFSLRIQLNPTDPSLDIGQLIIVDAARVRGSD